MESSLQVMEGLGLTGTEQASDPGKTGASPGPTDDWNTSSLG